MRSLLERDLDYFGANEDYIEEMRQERMEQRRRVRNLSCTDGFCGSPTCDKCFPSWRMNYNEEDCE